jgi:hypothetical protein
MTNRLFAHVAIVQIGDSQIPILSTVPGEITTRSVLPLPLREAEALACAYIAAVIDSPIIVTMRSSVASGVINGGAMQSESPLTGVPPPPR